MVACRDLRRDRECSVVSSDPEPWHFASACLTPGLSRGPRGAMLAFSGKQRDTRVRRLQADVRQTI